MPGTNQELDWRDRFYLCSFVMLATTDRRIERRELVWIKRFFGHAARGAAAQEHLAVVISDGHCNDAELAALRERARAELSVGEKRRFVYNLAQLCKSKGKLSSDEYEQVLEAAEQVGIRDTDADAIITSVYSVNDTFMAIVGLLAVGVILYYTQVVIVPLVIALFITMIITKVESTIARALGLRRFRWLNKVAALVVILGVAFGLLMAAISSGKDIAARLPYYQKKIAAAVQSSPTAMSLIARLQQEDAVESIKELPIASMLSAFLKSLVNIVGNFLLVVIFTGFLVFSGGTFGGILQEMNEKISAYISIKTLISLLTGVLVYILCLAFGVDFALFWATLGFLLNYIPSVGSIIGTIPPILIAAVQLDSWARVIAFAAIFVVMQVLLGQILEPKLMGSKLAIKPLAILLGLIFWGFLWGIPGMFLAAPLMALLRILSSYFNFSRSIERLLAADET
jgi:AI-2 transport protein TqsA